MPASIRPLHAAGVRGNPSRCWRRSICPDQARSGHSRALLLIECSASQQQSEARPQPQLLQRARKVVLTAAAAALLSTGTMMLPEAPAFAKDTAAVGACVLRQCSLALAQCLGDPVCVENLFCVNSCVGQPDEAGCQVRCGDLYSDAAVQTFDTCALSEKKCVPQVQDDGSFPAPPCDAVVEQLDTRAIFNGRYYITRGYNTLFDTFDCQEHYFKSTQQGKVTADINWRVSRPNGQFYERNAKQQLVQDPEMPGKLRDTGGEFLHFADDWYILGSRSEGDDLDYFLVYYRGNNDAWLGYGGGTLYTRARTTPPEIIPEVKEHLKKAGLDWDKWIETDNTCGPQPPSLVEREVQELEQNVLAFEKVLEKDVVDLEQEVEKDVLLLETELDKDAQEFGKSIWDAISEQLQKLNPFKKEVESEEASILAEAVEQEFDFLREKQEELTSTGGL